MATVFRSTLAPREQDAAWTRRGGVLATRFIRPASGVDCARHVMLPGVVEEGTIDPYRADRSARREGSPARGETAREEPLVVPDYAAAPTVRGRRRASRQPRRRYGDQTARAHSRPPPQAARR